MSEKFNRSYDWWSDTPQGWRNDDREESILDPKWNPSMSNANEFSEEEEVTKTLQRTRKIIRGGRKNRDSSDCETRLSSLNGNSNQNNKERQTKDYFRSGS